LKVRHNLRKRRFYSTPKSTKMLKYESFGDVDKVLKLVDENLPPLTSKDVLVKFMFAPINPADFNTIAGVYPILPMLPGVGGGEGVGKIVAVGNEVRNIKVNDIVVPSKPQFGTWRNYVVCNEKDMTALPSASGVKLEDLSCLTVNPSTAYRLLRDIVDLKEGDVVIQNGANSMVGLCVIQMAKNRGIKTINIIRKQRPDFDALKGKLTSLGATVVVGDEDVGKPEFKKSLSNLKKPKLALNCVGGNTVTEMARLLERWYHCNIWWNVYETRHHSNRIIYISGYYY